MAEWQFESTKYAPVLTAETEMITPTSSRYSEPVSKKKVYVFVATNFLIILLPMLVFTAVFLGLIYHNEKKVSPSSSPELDFPLNPGRETGVVFVSISAATLAFIASWSSTVATAVTGCVVTLIGYPVASLLRRQSMSNQFRLPSLSEMSLIISMLSGRKLQAVAEALKLSTRSHRTTASTGLGLLGLIVALISAWIVFAADTYLHLTTTSVLFTERRSWPTDIFGYHLTSRCAAGNNTYYGQLGENFCLITSTTDDPVGDASAYAGSFDAVNVLSNSSDVNSVYYFSREARNDSGVIPTLARSSYAWLGFPIVFPGVDYVADSFAVSTECKLVTKDCRTNATAYLDKPAYFTCAPEYPAFSLSSLNPGSWELFFFTSPQATSYDTRNGSDPGLPHKNEFTFGLASAAVPSIYPSEADSYFDPTDVKALGRYNFFTLMCTTSTWEVRYTFFNGSVVRDSWHVTPTNASVTNMMQSALAFSDVGYNRLADIVVESFLDLGVTGPVTFEKAFATRWSALVMALGSGATLLGPCLAAQQRLTAIVTQVRRSAIWWLVGANLTVASLGCVAFIAALAALRASSGYDVCHIVHRLSVKGVVEQALATGNEGSGGSGGDGGLELAKTNDLVSVERRLPPGKWVLVKRE